MIILFIVLLVLLCVIGKQKWLLYMRDVIMAVTWGFYNEKTQV